MSVIAVINLHEHNSRYDLSQKHITQIAICRKRFFGFRTAAEPSFKSETSSSTMFMFTSNLLYWLGVWAKSVSVLLIERLRNISMVLNI